MTTYPQPSDPVASLTRADGTTEAHSTDHGRVIGIWENVKHHGATGDGVTDDTAAIQAALDAIDVAGGGTIFFPPGTYLVSSTLLLPATFNTYEDYAHILGYGATLKTTAAITIMGRRNPADYSTDAVQMTGWKFHVEGIVFQGSGDSAQVGLDLIATYGSRVSSCYFYYLGTGLRTTFGLMTRVQSCMASSNSVYDYHARSGNTVFTGATTSNSGSNQTTFHSCHSAGSSGETAQFRIEASSGVTLENCVTEGGNPVNAISYAADATVCKLFTVKNHHSENSPTSAVIKATANLGGEVVVDGLWHQTSDCTLIDATGSASATIRVLDIPWWPTGSKFTHADQLWVFPNGVGQLHGGDAYLEQAGYWTTGAPPTLYQIGPKRETYLSNPCTKFKAVNDVEVHASRIYALQGLDLVDADVALGTTTGTKIGTATTQKLGFYNATPAVQPSAYTQTYATADKTQAAPTAATLTVTDGAGTNDNTIGAITADASVIAAVQELADEVNKLVADVADVKQITNSIIDDLQALGLVG